jgi:uncharacterized protein YecE (DUF72 family)
MGHAGRVRIGRSGLTCAPGYGLSYLKGLTRKRELEYAASQFSALEINGIFYSMQPAVFANWAGRVPANVMFAVKAPRYIAHVGRLHDAAMPRANIIASGLLRLGPKLGPILWQSPPSSRFNARRIERFLQLLPYDTETAARFGHGHDGRLKTPAWLNVDTNRKPRHAIEIHNETFLTRTFVDLLGNYDVALECADTVKGPRVMDLTSDFVYCRLHGSEELDASDYDDDGWIGGRTG